MNRRRWAEIVAAFAVAVLALRRNRWLGGCLLAAVSVTLMALMFLFAGLQKWFFPQ